jgi:hypothetical protein
MSGTEQGADAFAEIKEHGIAALWAMLGLPGEPKPHGSMRSPLREERTPSFSIFDDGHAWKDHGTGEGGDGVEFVRAALGTDHAGVRTWWMERSGGGELCRKPKRSNSTPKPPAPPKRIQWPAELIEGTEATWQAFANKRGLSFPAVGAAVRTGLLRFCRIDGKACYVVTDNARRSAEIRRCDGEWFSPQCKPYWLTGVDKSWPAGCALLENAPAFVNVLLVEGASDFLTAIGHYVAYGIAGGKNSWAILGLLGASCKTLAPEAAALIRGRRVRLIPDGDVAGDDMAAHWQALLLSLRCTVERVKLPRGKDLRDLKDEIEPADLFS